MMKSLTEGELGYIAGIFDGEGHIGLAKTKRKGTNDTFSVLVDVTNTNRLLLEWMKSKTEMGIIDHGEDSSRKAHWKRAYALRFRTEEVTILLPAIMPYLLIKQIQAELVLEFITKSQKIGSKSKDEDVILEQEFIYRELALLNKRGV